MSGEQNHSHYLATISISQPSSDSATIMTQSEKMGSSEWKSDSIHLTDVGSAACEAGDSDTELALATCQQIYFTGSQWWYFYETVRKKCW